MNVEKLDEQVRVFADFNGVKVRPIAFIRSTGRRYDIDKVNLVYRARVSPGTASGGADGGRVGDRYHWCFAVSDDVNTYVLFYDPENLIWTLKEMQMEG